MVDHRGPRARQRVVVEHDLVALPFRIGEAPGPRHFSGEDGDHGSYAAACAALPGSFIVGGVRSLRSGPPETVEPTVCAPRRLKETTGCEQPQKDQEAAVSLVP